MHERKIRKGNCCSIRSKVAEMSGIDAVVNDEPITMKLTNRRHWFDRGVWLRRERESGKCESGVVCKYHRQFENSKSSNSNSHGAETIFEICIRIRKIEESPPLTCSYRWFSSYFHHIVDICLLPLASLLLNSNAFIIIYLLHCVDSVSCAMCVCRMNRTTKFHNLNVYSNALCYTLSILIVYMEIGVMPKFRR